MTDYLWNGPVNVILSAIYEEDGKTLKSGISGVIGPRTLDGKSYVNVRATVDLETPEGASVTGSQLSAAIIGTWFDSYLGSYMSPTPIVTSSVIPTTTTAGATTSATTAPTTADTTSSTSATATGATNA